MKIILASASPRRRELLDQVGWEFCVRVSKVEEIITKIHPGEIVEELSELKAEYKKTTANIATYKNILDNRDVMTDLIIKDMERIKKEYGRPRRTTIEDAEEIVIKAPAINC